MFFFLRRACTRAEVLARELCLGFVVRVRFMLGLGSGLRLEFCCQLFLDIMTEVIKQ